MRWLFDHLLVKILFCCLVTLMRSPNANAQTLVKLSADEEQVLEIIRQSMNLPTWEGDSCELNWVLCANSTTSEGNPTSVTTVLSALYLSGRKLEGRIPPDIAKLQNLIFLYLDHNRLSGPIPDISNMTELLSLRLDYNNFSGGIPASLSKLQKLKILNLSNNSFSGLIPDEFVFLQPVTDLSLQLNSLTSIPHDLRNLTSLTTLIVYSNIISGNYPNFPLALISLRGCTLLKTIELDFSNNSFSGEIPRSWTDLLLLEEMEIGNNVLHGVIPKEIGNLRSLEKLNLSNNLFYGPIPEEMSLLVNLQILDLRNNQLSGIVPESLLKLSQLQSLHLDNNNFTGIPVGLIAKSNLTITFGNLKIIYGNETRGSTGSSLSTSGIVGLAAGTLCAGLAVIAIIVLLLRRGKKRKYQTELSKQPGYDTTELSS